MPAGYNNQKNLFCGKTKRLAAIKPHENKIKNLSQYIKEKLPKDENKNRIVGKNKQKIAAASRTTFGILFNNLLINGTICVVNLP